MTVHSKQTTWLFRKLKSRKTRLEVLNLDVLKGNKRILTSVLKESGEWTKFGVTGLSTGEGKNGYFRNIDIKCK
jgi:hypothetical protein